MNVGMVAGVTSLEDLRVGTVVSGRVQNVTHFGAFVDIGVGRDGLIPMSKTKGMTPQFGDRVEVRVVQLEVERKRITLELLRMLWTLFTDGLEGLFERSQHKV